MPEDAGLNETTEPQSSQLTADSQTIVDTVLDLDEALSGDVRRAERTARFSIKPWLQADLDRLEGELSDLVDDRGRPLERSSEQALASAGRDYLVVMEDYRKAHDDYVKSMRSVVVSAMAPSAWDAFKTKWSKQISAEQMSDEMRKELVVGCAIKPSMTLEQYAQLLDRYGEAAMANIGRAAWAACDHTGVDAPKSPVFSVVQRQLALSQS